MTTVGKVEKVARAITRSRLLENKSLSDETRNEQIEAFWHAYISDAQAAIDAIELQKHPVAFRVSAPWRDGWMIFEDEEKARSIAEGRGVEYQGLYVRSPE